MVTLCKDVTTNTRWNSIVVVEQIIDKCLVALNPPKTILIGMDGKYATVMQRMVPTYLMEPFLERTMYRLRPQPDCMKKLRKQGKI
jgi:hypothetical protein